MRNGNNLESQMCAVRQVENEIKIRKKCFVLNGKSLLHWMGSSTELCCRWLCGADSNRRFGIPCCSRGPMRTGCTSSIGPACC